MISIGDLKINIKKELGSFFSTEAHNDISIQRYINSAIRDICIQKNFDFNKYIKEYEILDKGIAVNIDYNIETYYVKQGEAEVDFFSFEDYYNGGKDKGVGIFGDKLISETTGKYTIYYRGYPETITSLEGNIDIPGHFFDLIVVKAVSFGFADIRAYQQMQLKNSIYEGMIKNLATRSTNTSPLKIKRLNKSNNKIW